MKRFVKALVAWSMVLGASVAGAFPVASSGAAQPAEDPGPHRVFLPLVARQLEASLLPVGQLGGAMDAVTVDASHIYVGVGPRVEVLDRADPARPERVGQSEVLVDIVRDLERVHDHLYAATADGIVILSVAGPGDPQVVGFLPLSGGAGMARAASGRLYVAALEAGLIVYDLTVLSAPLEIGRYDTDGSVGDLALSGDFAVLGDSLDPDFFRGRGGLRVVDVADVEQMHETDFVTTPESGGETLAARDGTVYVAWNRLTVFDLDQAGRLSERGQFDDRDLYAIASIEPRGAELFMATGTGLWMVDFSDPAQPRTLARVPAADSRGDLALVDDLALLTARWPYRLVIVDVSTPAAAHAVGEYGSVGDLRSVQVLGERAFAYEPSRGLVELEVADPSRPQRVGLAVRERNGFDSNSSWVVSGTHAYSVDGWLMDIELWGDALGTIGWGADRSAEAVAVEGGYAFVAVTDNAGYDQLHPGHLAVVDIRDPVNPREVAAAGVIAGHGLHLVVAAGMAYLTEREPIDRYESVGVLRIFDVRDPLQPAELARLRVDGDVRGIAYDDGLVVLADFAPGGGIIVVDVADAAAPRIVSRFSEVPDLGPSRAVAMADGIAYARTDGALVAVDVTEPSLPHVVASIRRPLWSLAAIAAVGEHVFLVEGVYGLKVLRLIRRP